jgi:hypothetical protein
LPNKAIIHCLFPISSTSSRRNENTIYFRLM